MPAYKNNMQRFILILLLSLAPGLAFTQSGPRLLEAARTGDTALVQSFIQQEDDVNAPAGDGSRALHWAVHMDDTDMAALLLGAGADVNVTNDLGVSPLWLASENASYLMVQLLLEAGADPNAMLPSGETPLMMAARTGNPSVVAVLLDASANVNARENHQQQTALMWAAAQDHPSVVEVLLAHAADINARSSTWVELTQPEDAPDAVRDSLYEIIQGGFTALLFAAEHGNVKVAELLLDAGADVNEMAPGGSSALLLASLGGHGDLARLLLDRGADPYRMEMGFSALHAAIPHQDVDLVRALLEHGADPNQPVLKHSNSRRDSRDYAISIRLTGTTPFWMAAWYKQAEMMRDLVAAGADPGYMTASQDTAMMLAIDGPAPFLDESTRGIADPIQVEAKVIAVIDYARELGVDVNAGNRNGDTALHKAATRGMDRVVRHLAMLGADLEAANARGQTPLDMARRLRARDVGLSATSNLSTENLLRELGASK